MKYLISAVVCGLGAPLTAFAGSINGTVRGADGSVVQKAVVTAYRQRGTLEKRPVSTSLSTSVLPDGTFRLSPLSDGSYQICVQAPESIWLNPCEWGSTATTATISQAQQSAELSILLAQGAVVTVRVNDAAQLLTTHEGKTPGAHLLVGIRTDSLSFQQAAITAPNTAGRSYRVIVPFDRSFRLTVASAFFQVTDATGKALPKTGNILPVIVPSGQPAPALVLNIVGINR